MAERRPRGPLRLPMLENFEARQLMAADMQIAEPLTQSVSASAVVLACQPVTVTERVSDTTQYFDVDGDGRISNLDFLGILDHLNQRSTIRSEKISPDPSNVIVANVEGEDGPTSDAIDSLERMDVNSDGQVSPLDVLLIANQIQLYNPLTPCTCGACLSANPGIKCETAALEAQAALGAVELAPQWQPQ